MSNTPASSERPSSSPAQLPQSPVEAMENLPARQNAALQEILSGKSVAEAAQLAGVGRSTLYRWMESDAQFRAAYNQWQAQVKFHTRARLAALSESAVAAVQKALEAGDAKLGYTILKSMGFMTEQEPGLSDPSQVARRMELDARRHEVVLRQDQDTVEDQEDSLLPRTPEEWAERENPGQTGK